jgi:hypothetical protein
LCKLPTNQPASEQVTKPVTSMSEPASNQANSKSEPVKSTNEQAYLQSKTAKSTYHITSQFNKPNSQFNKPTSLFKKPNSQLKKPNSLFNQTSNHITSQFKKQTIYQPIQEVKQPISPNN